MEKPVMGIAEALADVPDGATVLVGGFGGAGSPIELVHALIDQGARDLTVVNNNAGNGDVGLAALIRERRVRKMICSFPRSANPKAFTELYLKGEIELEVVPQGTLAERIRAGGAGIPAFYTPASVGTPLAEGKEVRTFDGRDYVMEHWIRADYALVKAETADRAGNLLYNMSARNFGPVMCMAAQTTVVQVRNVVEPGAIDPEAVVTPGIFVDRIVQVADPAQEELLFAEGAVYP
ncbi:3-oxoacid CoA-transferase subunit A [Futiania mangrovi]|uniref:3-oxoacid CoA-transferase subunit A n=1 Tax=Futiania mangrovi TaxID=2959716 RepID=A0A9J6PGW2_9PROT|nr:3-oxoacid CoA-transferase subunit A [Futiania mangrovii]MCP1337734.1 3-oxoacid CoA-transferase subunit A [Futiania mangrovii]